MQIYKLFEVLDPIQSGIMIYDTVVAVYIWLPQDYVKLD